jgi:ubiquitin-protein ligase
MKNVVISKETVNRLIKDVKDIIKSPLDENGIYYQHDEEDMLKAVALIVGQKGTPYFAGYYFFEIHYPSDYPYSPPKVTFCTNGDKIRFNPNLYTNGKVCISILNTWAGEQWSACQSIRSVLLTLSMLLCKDPLLNEPGITQYHIDFQRYTTLIEYKNIEIAVLHMINKRKGYYDKKFDCFYQILLDEFEKNKDEIKSFLLEKVETTPKPFPLQLMIYRHNLEVIDYVKLLKQFC